MRMIQHNGRWYVENVSQADALYVEHLEQLKKEGACDG